MPTLALNDDLVLPVPQGLAWQSLHDLALMADSLPDGATLRTGDAPRSFLLAIAGFEGRLLMLDLDAPGRIRLSFEGRSAHTGAVTGQAQLRLESLGEDRALLHVALVLQAERETPSKVAGLLVLKERLAALKAAIERRFPSDRPKPVRTPPKPWPQRLLDWYLGWFAAIFNGTLFPPPKPRQRGPRTRR